jgi:hypothetical protein
MWKSKEKEKTRKKKNWNEKALKEDWLCQAGTLTKTKLSKLKSGMDEFDVESARALQVIESYGAFRDTEVTVEDDMYSGERCDDVPIVRLVRIREFEARMMLQDLRRQHEDGFSRKRANPELNKLMKDHARTIADIKEASQQYKIDIRSASKSEEMALEAHKEAMTDVLERLKIIKDKALDLINELRRLDKKKGYDHAGYASNVMPEQAEFWKRRWLETSLAVNHVIDEHWSKVKTAMRDDALKAGAVDDPNEAPWHLDYIGSLAKGVKGPPKQHIAFDPDKFDVDANLTAPILSAWALARGSVPDRDRLWGRKDPNLRRIGSLQSFQNAVHLALSQIPGYDADDPFEVVVKAEVVVEDEAIELVKSYLIELKRLSPPTLFTNFLSVRGVRDMLDGNDNPRADSADDLLGELLNYASENGVNLGRV